MTAMTEDDVQRCTAMADDLKRSIVLLTTQLIARENQLSHVESLLSRRHQNVEQTTCTVQDARDDVQISAAAANHVLLNTGERSDNTESLGNLLPSEVSIEQAKQLDEQEKIDDLSKLLKRKATEVEREAEAHRRTASALAEAEIQVARRYSEIVILTRMLGEQQDLNTEEKQLGKLMRQIYAAQGDITWRWRFLPRSWQARRLHRRLAKLGLFDAEAYLHQNPDVAAYGMDPLRHYILHGILEGRKF